MSINRYLENTDLSEKPLSRDLYTQLGSDILDGRLRPGEKLTERRICEQYEVSRTPVREALAKLESDGLIDLIPNRGAFVRGLSGRDLRDLFEYFAAGEVLAVPRAIGRITKEEMARLSEVFDYMVYYTKKNDVGKILPIVSAFHTIIFESTHNPALSAQLKRYMMYLDRALPAGFFRPDYLQTVLAEHRAIFQAFLAKDPKAGVEAMKVYVDHTRRRRFEESENERPSVE